MKNTSLVSKYFWEFNKGAIKETAEIIKNLYHPRYNERMVVLLSRCDKPKELFSLITKDQFVDAWPGIRSSWVKFSKQTDFKAWWESIYEQLVFEYTNKIKTPKGEPFEVSAKIGKMIKESRIKNGFSQSELALKTGIEQPDISKIEKGQKNITLATLVKICRFLNINKIDLR